jgi:hypothetical protein
MYVHIEYQNIMLKQLLKKLRHRPPCPCETLGPVEGETWEKLVHHVPNRATRRALHKSDAGKGLTHHESIEAMFKHLKIH